MKLKILIYEAEEGGYWAEVPALRGCVSEGETLDETLMNIKEAALGWLETASEEDMEHYGRTDVDFYKIDEETYYMDFSV